MDNVLGLAETKDLVDTIEATDVMAKSTNIQLIGYEKIGSRLVTVMARGDVGVVRAVVDTGGATVSVAGEVESNHVIPHSHDDVGAIPPKSVWPKNKGHCVKQSLGLLEVSGLTLAVTCADAMAKATATMLLALRKINDFGQMVVKIVDGVTSIQAAMMTGAELTDRQQGLVAQKVIIKPDAGLLSARIEAPSPVLDATLKEENAVAMDERRNPADTLPHPAEQVIYSLCLDPHCPR